MSKAKATGDDMMRIPPVIVHEIVDHKVMAGEENWGHRVFGLQPIRDAVAGGPEVLVGVVDDGCDYDHPGLSYAVRGWKSFIGKDLRGGGHGTHCAGTICGKQPEIGVSQNVGLYAAQGLDPVSGSGSMTALMSGIEWCLSNGCVIVSCSWGGGSLNPADDRRFREWAEHPSKPWLVFAAGNSGAGTPQTDAPGRSTHLFNVAALNMNLTPASFTSSGTKIDCAGPGVDIWSYAPGGRFARMSGTSMATPWSAGTLSLFRSGIAKNNRPVPSVYELRDLTTKWNTDVHTPGDDLRTGTGRLTPVGLMNYLEPDAPPPPAI